MKLMEQDNRLMPLEAVKERIVEGRTLVINGDEALLSQLPQGNWIGATTTYFYVKGERGRLEKGQLFVTDFSDLAEATKIETLSEATLPEICTRGFDNGFQFLFIPANRPIHLSFALNAPRYEGMYLNPLIGLVAGVQLEDFEQGKLTKTFNGKTGEALVDDAVVLHAKLPADKVARLEIVNVFEHAEGLTIEVDEDSFTVSDCLINGQPGNLYDYVKENDLDISLPLVADYAGATINTSFQALDDDKREVVFYAPLFRGKSYTHSKKLGNYADVFGQRIQTVLAEERSMAFNCNCILNYVYGELENHDIGFSGPTAFGEIAYRLINQTFTYLAIDEA